MTLAMPRPGRPCRCLMDAAGPGSWPGGSGDTMNASDIDAAGRSALTRPGAAAGHPGTEQRHGRRRRFSLRAPGGACHRASAIASALGRGRRQLTPALLGAGYAARPPILRRSVPAGRQSAAAEDAATDPTYQRKTPCPNQPHPVRIRALPPSGRAHPLTAPPHPSRRSRRCHRRLRRRTRAHSGPRSACSAGRCRRCARCCAEPPAMRSPGRRAGGQRPSWLAVRHPACPRSRDRRRHGALRGS